MELQYKTFIGDKYRALQEEEQLFFQAAPTARVAKKAIQLTAIAPAAAVAATHLPLVGPAIAGAVGQTTHLIHSGIHGIRADQIAKNFADLASQVPQGWGRQSAFDAWTKVRTADMLAKTDAWARPLSGLASPTLIGKGIIDTSKLAISYASQGVPTVVARPIVHAWKMTNHYINRAKDWFEQTLSKLPVQVQQNVRSAIDKVQQQDIRNAIDNVQRRTTGMAENLNQAPVPNGLDSGRRADYVRLLSDSQNDPNLTYESIQENIKRSPDLGADYDKQVTYQALRENKGLDEATAIITQGPNVAEMSQTNLQDVSVYLGETTGAVWKQYNLENPSPEANQDLEPEAQTVVEVDAAVVNPSVELDTDAQQQYSQLLGEYEDNPDLTWEEVQSRLKENPDLVNELDQKVVDQAALNGVDVEEVQKLVTTEANFDAFEQGTAILDAPSESQSQYAELLSEALESGNLTYADIQEHISEDPQLQEYYDELVVLQGQENGMGEDEARDIISKASEPDEIESSQAPQAEKQKASEPEDLDPLRMINEEIVEKLGRHIEIGNMRVFLNKQEIFRLNGDGMIDHNRSPVDLEQAQMIREALKTPEKFKGTLTIKVGTRTILRIQDGIAIPDRYGLAGKDTKAEVDIPKDDQQQGEAKGQKTEVETPKADTQSQQTKPEDNQVESKNTQSQTESSTVEGQDELAGFTQEQKDTINGRQEKGLDSSKLIAKIKKNNARPPVEKKEESKREVSMSR